LVEGIPTGTAPVANHSNMHNQGLIYSASYCPSTKDWVTVKAGGQECGMECRTDIKQEIL